MVARAVDIAGRKLTYEWTLIHRTGALTAHSITCIDSVVGTSSAPSVKHKQILHYVIILGTGRYTKMAVAFWHLVRRRNYP